MKKAQLQPSVFHMIAIMLSIMLVMYIGITQNKIKTETLTSNSEAQHLNLVRRLMSSPDCLAYEHKSHEIVDNNGLVGVFSSKLIRPYVIDMRKFEDWSNFNCLRNVVGLSGVSEKPVQFRYYNITIRNLDTNAKVSKVTTYPNRFDIINGDRVGSNIIETRECENKFFYEALPVKLYNTTGSFNDGIVYIKSCIVGQFIDPTSIGFSG